MKKHLSIPLAIFTSSAILLSGCQTTNPYTGEQQTSKTTSGAAIGAAAGAMIGYITSSKKDRRKGLLIGAGVGALAGGAVGNYMDQQEAKLRQRLEGTGVSVTRDGDRIILNMASNVTFQTNSADLNAQFFEVLNSVGLVLNEFSKTLIVVEGHTDNTGSDSYNQQLSERRALAVSSYLISQKINPDRIMTAGYGEARPITSNNTPEGRAQNRRVELTLEPITQS